MLVRPRMVCLMQLMERKELCSKLNVSQVTLVHSVSYVQLEHSNNLTHMETVCLVSINQRTLTMIKEAKSEQVATINVIIGKAPRLIKNA